MVINLPPIKQLRLNPGMFVGAFDLAGNVNP